MHVNKCNNCTEELHKDSIISKNKSFVNLSGTPFKKCKWFTGENIWRDIGKLVPDKSPV